jgi:hydrogenase maturation protein HypF
VLGVAETSFEGQGPMGLEAIAVPVNSHPEFTLAPDDAGLLRLDWAPLVHWLVEDTRRDAAERAGAVHAAFAAGLVAVAERLRAAGAGATVGLTGGVFQNRVLAECASTMLEHRGFRVLLPVEIPCNDGGLSYGQIADFAGRTV